MELSYRPDEDEFVGAQMDYWLRIRKRHGQRAVDIVGVFLIVAAVFDLFRPSSHNWAVSVLFGLLGVWMLGSRRVWWPYSLRRAFRQSPSSQEHHIAVNDEGLRITLPQSKEEVRWGAFQKAHETENAFLLLYSPVSFFIIPKRAFPADAIEDFRRILHEKGLL